MRISLKIFIYVAILSLTIFGRAAPQIKSAFSITIDSLTLTKEQPLDTLDVILTSNGRSMGGVDLKFGFDSDLIEIMTIVQGKILDSCGWKIFNSREAIESGKDDLPQSMWQILAMAEFGPDSLRPTCYSIDRPVSLARIIVSLDTSKIKAPLTYTVIPIYFLWEDCTDNTITNGSGDSLFISESVDKLHSTDPSVLGARFPTRLGASSKCINPLAKNPPLRRIAFKNGGVHITYSTDSTK